LDQEVKLLSLQIHRLADNTALASLNILANSCVTLGEYSSCMIDSEDSRNSRLRVLVYDLEEGVDRRYSCDVHTVTSFGIPKASKWSITVTRESE
jgi:hypothetical protein